MQAKASPLDMHVWEVALWQHPNCLFVEYVLQGLEQGFYIGFDGIHPI